MSDSPSSGDLGAAYELAVASDLMLKGFQVFRNLSPNGKTDLIAAKHGNLLRVQVKCYGMTDAEHNDVSAEYNDGNIRYTVEEGLESLFQTSPLQSIPRVRRKCRAYIGNRRCQINCIRPEDEGYCYQHRSLRPSNPTPKKPSATVRVKKSECAA